MSITTRTTVKCDHILFGIAFPLSECPRCRGNGFYFDLNFEKGGSVDFINKELKLAQDAIKIILTRIFENIFIPKYGTKLQDIPGNKLSNFFVIEEMRRSIARAMKFIQLQRFFEGQKGVIIDPEEEILEIRKIDINTRPNDPTNLLIDIELVNKKETLIPISVAVTV